MIPVIQDSMPKNKVTVIEFFSYGCPACYKLEPDLQKWLAKQPSYVTFYRVPVTFQPNWDIYARSYYVAQQLGVLNIIHPALFHAIEENGLTIDTPEKMAALFAANGVDKQKFLNGYYATPSIEPVISHGLALTNNLMVFQIPALVIDGKYKVDPSLSGANYDRMFSVINRLVHMSYKDKSK